METPIKTDTPERQERRMEEWVGTGWAIEAVCGVAAIILAIAGLTYYDHYTMAGVSAIVLGSALFLQGFLVSAEYNAIVSRFEAGAHAEFGSGIGVEGIVGVAAIVLGIMMLAGFTSPHIFMGVATLLLGGGLVLSSGVAARLNSVKVEITKGTMETRAQSRYAVIDASITQVIVGIAAAVLGLLALLNISPGVLTLVAMLAMGVSTFYSGGAVAGRMWAFVKR